MLEVKSDDDTEGWSEKPVAMERRMFTCGGNGAHFQTPEKYDRREVQTLAPIGLGIVQKNYQYQYQYPLWHQYQ